MPSADVRPIVLHPPRGRGADDPPADLRPPLSKSDAHRALVLRAALGQPLAGALGTGRSLDDAPDDVRVIGAGLEALAAPGDATIDCVDGGAPLRFLVTQAAIRAGGAPVTLTGTARLGERPHRPLLDALSDALAVAGLRVEQGDPWPLRLRPATDPSAAAPAFAVDGTRSSQYASSLALGCAALARRDGRAWSVSQTGEPLASLGYLELTLRWIERAGFAVERDGRRTVIGPAARDVPALPPPPGDWSSLGYLLAIAWRTGARVLDVDLQADHPDRAVVDVLGEAGIAVTVEGTTARVDGTPRAGLCASGVACPDLLPTLAAVACVLPEPSVLHRVDLLRAKESDRLAAILDLVTAAGGRTELEGTTLRILPPDRVRTPIAIASRGDHRVAMAAATLAIVGGATLHLDDASCVSKSFPGFWAEVERVGATIERGGDASAAAERPSCA